jgi:hypothetical protein
MQGNVVQSFLCNVDGFFHSPHFGQSTLHNGDVLFMRPLRYGNLS